jgi:hypothetical protein
MLEVEAQAFVREQIIPRWPRWKRSGVGVSDFIRQLKKIDTTTAEEAIIRTKENSKTYTWPVLSEFRQYIAEVIRENHTPSQNTEPKWVECYALETDTGKSIELCVPAGLSEEGMKAEFARHLERYDLNPTDFTLYIGQENFDKFFNDRYEAKCFINPSIKEKTAQIATIAEKKQAWQKILDEIPF